MANLTSQANRMTDVEINNNKPVTSQVFRRFGSNINFLLDLVGATDGSTSTGGYLGTLSTNKATITYSLTLDNSVIGTSRSLFTFNGGGDRPLRFYQTDGGVAIYNADDIKPIKLITDYLAFFSYGGFGSIGTVFTIQLDGVTISSLSRSGGAGGIDSFTQLKEITIAPSGSHTIGITKHMTTSGTQPTVSGSLSYLFI